MGFGLNRCCNSRQDSVGECFTMKPGIPWSVKGVQPELREAAKTAARRSGMTLGEWLNSAINEQADGAAPTETATPAPAALRSRISTHPIERAATRLEDIAEQLSRLAQRDSDTVQRYVPQQVEDNIAFAKVLGRVESSERQTVEAFSAVNERLSLLSRQITKAQPTAMAKPEEAPGFVALEKAVRNIVEHLEVSEKRTRDNLKTLQERVGGMSARVNSADDEHVARQAPAFSQLETRLNDLARRVDQSQAQPSPALPDLLRRELDELAGRIETVRDSSEALANKAQTQAVQTAQAELRTIEQRILGLLREAQTSFVATSTSPAEIQRFRGEIEKLNNRIDETSKGVASDRDVTALRVAVEQLSTRVAQGPDTRPMAEMDQRILDISQRLEQSQQRDTPQFGELERRMAELDHRLNDAIRLQGDGQAQVELEHKLVEVNDRLAKTEHQLTHLGTIERAIAQLYESMEQNRNWTREVAEEAAGRVGQHILSQPSHSSAGLAGSPEIIALEQGLHAVREASQHADARNQETLEAVHETLEQIVAKLAELETAAIGQRVAYATAPLAEAVQEATHSTVFGATRPNQTYFEPQPHNIDTEPLPEPLPTPAFAPAGNHNPFEAMIQAARLTDDAPELQSDETDYLAAARRAHQAAAQQKNILGGISPSGARISARSSKKLMGISLPFGRTNKNTKTLNLGGDIRLPPEIMPAKSNVVGSRRTLVLSGLFALSVVAFLMGRNMLGLPGHVLPVAQPAAITQPADQSQLAAPAVAKPDAATAPSSPASANQPAAPAGQHSESTTTPEPDDILTGSISQATAPKPTAPIATAIDLSIGTSSLRQAAEAGNSNAQFVIATRYLNGENVTADAAKAAYWYGKAAASGLAPAQYRVATLFERGTGVEKNMAAALAWYERAGVLGNVKAMHNAAVISAGNEAGSPNYAAAYKWFSLAAAHGLKDSEFNLAVLIERGMGTKADPAEALFWYYAAAAQQDADAQTHADALAKSLSPAIVAAVQDRLQKWVPEKTLDAANVVAIEDKDWKDQAQIQQQGTVEPAPAKPLDMIGTAQQLLDKLGYNIGQADGKLGGRTTNAIRLFQLQQGMKVTGTITPELIDAMQSKIG